MSAPRERYTLDLTDDEAKDLREWIGTPGALRKKPARRRREAPDTAATVNRMLTAWGRQVSDDPDALPELRELQGKLEAVIGEAVRACNAAGYPWAEIGKRLGMTKQGVQQRYGRRP